MIWQLRIGNWKFTFTFAQVTDVIGVNSTLPDGNHILMWDFDNVPLKKVVKALKAVQAKHKLPDIYVFNSGKPGNYMAFCYKRLKWRSALAIVLETKHVDYNFIKYAVWREHFTLRVSPKCGRWIRCIGVIKSKHKPTANVKELKSWVEYETLTRSSKKYVLEIPPIRTQGSDTSLGR
jgi:hypothetical protein